MVKYVPVRQTIRNPQRQILDCLGTGKLQEHCPKNILNLRIKTDPVSARVDAKACSAFVVTETKSCTLLHRFSHIFHTVNFYTLQNLYGQVRLFQVMGGQVRLDQVMGGQVRLDQVRLGQVRLGQDIYGNFMWLGPYNFCYV